MAYFDWIAPYYDRLSRWVFGDSLLAAQRHFLPRVPKGAHVLFLGGGSGLLLDDLLGLPQVQSVTYVEASARMLAMAQERVAHLRTNSHRPLPPVHFMHGTECDIPQRPHYSVAITNFVLDMYKPLALRQMMRTIETTLAPQALWLFTDFEISKQPHRRWWHRPLVKSMFLFFCLTAGLAVFKLPNYQTAFESIGFAVQEERKFYGELIVSRVYSKPE